MSALAFHRTVRVNRGLVCGVIKQRGARWRCVGTPTGVTQAGTGERDELPRPGALELRVGKILTCEIHPEADTLFVEEIDVGEETPRTICSGLVEYTTAETLREALVVVVCNLKARKLRGVKSHGMLLCASDREKGIVKPLVPPNVASIGELIVFGDGESEEPATENQVKKKKMWEKLQPLMKTNADGIATCDGLEMRVASGPITCRELTNTSIS